MNSDRVWFIEYHNEEPKEISQQEVHELYQKIGKDNFTATWSPKEGCFYLLTIQKITKGVLDVLLRPFPENQLVIFAPITHTEYSILFWKVGDTWHFDGCPLLQCTVIEIDYTRSNEFLHEPVFPNGYLEGSEDPTHIITFGMYMREDGVLIVMS